MNARSVVDQKSAMPMQTPAMENAKNVQAPVFIPIQILVEDVVVPELAVYAAVAANANFVKNRMRPCNDTRSSNKVLNTDAQIARAG